MNVPHAPDAEAALLGGLLTGASDATETLARIEPDDLYLSKHRAVYEATADTYAELGRPDPAAVVERLRTSGRLDDVGGAMFVHDLVASAFHASPTVAHHADAVADAARRRRFIESGQAIIEAAGDPAADLDGRADAAVAAMFSTNGHAPVRRANDAWKPLIDKLSGAGPSPLSIGLPGSDEHIKIMRGQLTVVTGVPSGGKSELVDAVALHMARTHGWRWAVYSPEAAPFEDWLEAMLHRLLGHRFDGGMFDGDEVDKHMDWLHERFAWLDVDVCSKLPTLLAQARWLNRSAGLDGLIIDPWNKITYSRHRHESTTEAIGRHLAGIVRFARAEQVHVVVVAHPTKMEKAAGGGYKTPTLYDISGSAEFYNQADFGLAVSRGSHGGASLHVQKVRRQPDWGKQGKVDMRFDQATRRYTPETPV